MNQLVTARRAFSNLKDLQVIAVRTKDNNVLTRQLNNSLVDLGMQKVERFSLESLDSAIDRTQAAFNKLYEPSMEGLVSKFFDLFSSKKIDTDSFIAEQGIGKEYEEGKEISINVKPEKFVLLAKDGDKDPYTAYVNFYESSMQHLKVLKEASDFYVNARKEYFAVLKKAFEKSPDGLEGDLYKLNAKYEKPTAALIEKLKASEKDLNKYVSSINDSKFSFKLPSKEVFDKANDYAEKARSFKPSWKFHGEYDYQLNEDDKHSFANLESEFGIYKTVEDTVIDKLFSAVKDNPLLMLGHYGTFLNKFTQEIS